VDDGSTDNTEQVVKGMADERTHYTRITNSERGAARNRGVAIAKGDYVNFFDSDDLAFPHHLSDAVKLIAEKNEPEWFHLGYAWARPGGAIFKYVDGFKSHTLNAVLASGNHLSANGVFLRKDIALAYPFNEARALSASEDYELWLRLAPRFPLYYSNRVTSLIVDHHLRSERTIRGDQLIRRLQLLLQTVQQDKVVMQFFGKDFKKIQADSYSYIALHIGDSGKFKKESMHYYIKSFLVHPGIVGNKRFYVILKNLLTKW
jgi:glycosyltransferase involved in cell wall biosynthesis